jgi:hypothetical protein
MKALQVVLTVAVLVGVVFGLTYLMQFARSPVEPQLSKTGLLPTAPPLRFPERIAVWDPEDANYSAEFESGPKGVGHYDFWASNANAKPVSVSLILKSCTCANVQLGLVPAAEWANAQSREAALATALGVVQAPQLAGLVVMPPLVNSIPWKPLTRDPNRPPVPESVPAADPTAGPQIAVFRLGWEPREPKQMRLTAELQHQFDNNLETTTLEVPVAIVTPLMVSTPNLNVGELGYGERRDAKLYVWSATRPALTVRVEDVLHDPCVEIGPPVPLTEQERRDVPRALVRAAQIPQASHMRCGYAVQVTIHERRGDNQLDLGPFSRKLLVNGGTDEEQSVLLTGTVRGRIQVGDKADRDRVDLGTFKAVRAVERNIVITSDDPTVRLELAQKHPESMQVELKEQPGGFGQKRWKMRVEAGPNMFSGLLPQDTAIYLQILGDPPRRIRIPVVGNATH